MNLENTIRLASKRLKSNNIPSYALDAQIILADILGVERESLITNNQMNISDKNLQKYEKAIKRRINKDYFRLSEVDALIGDYSKAKKDLGWSPSVEIDKLSEIMVKADIENLTKNLNQ